MVNNNEGMISKQCSLNRSFYSEGIITEIKKDLKRELLNWTVKHATPG